MLKHSDLSEIYTDSLLMKLKHNHHKAKKEWVFQPLPVFSLYVY